MRVLAADLEVQGGAQRFSQGTEKMFHHLGRQLADAVAREFAIKAERSTPGQVERDPRLALVHRQQEAITPDTVLVAERLAQGRAETDGDVFHRMVLIDLEIPVTAEPETEAAVLGDLLEHVIEKADAGRYGRVARRIEIDCRLDASLAGVSHDACRTLRVTQDVHDLRPRQSVSMLAVDEQSAHADALGQLHIGFPITDDRGGVQIDVTRSQ